MIIYHKICPLSLNFSFKICGTSLLTFSFSFVMLSWDIDMVAFSLGNWTYFLRWENRIIMDKWQCKPVVSKNNKNWLSYFNSLYSLTNSPPFYYRNYFCAQSFVIHWTNISDLNSRCHGTRPKKILFMVNVNYWHYSSLIQTNK